MLQAPFLFLSPSRRVQLPRGLCAGPRPSAPVRAQRLGAQRRVSVGCSLWGGKGQGRWRGRTGTGKVFVEGVDAES